MSHSKGQYAYKKANVATASPEKLVLMLYDGLIRFLQAAEQAIQEKNIEEAHIAICKAQAIVSELSSSVKLDAGEVAVNLFRLYDFMQATLVQANLQKDASLVQAALKVSLPLRDAWKKISLKKGPAVPSSK